MSFRSRFNSRLLRSLIASTTLAALVSVSGCGKAKEPWEIVYPAKGVVTYKGKPLSGAVVTLIPQQPELLPDSVRPRATSKEDGTFVVGSFTDSDGAPAGKYTAVVKHFPVITKGNSAVSGPNSLPAKYASPQTSGLTIEIPKGGAEIPPLKLE